MKKYTIWLVSAVMGVVIAALLYGFEFIGINVTNWLWNDLLQSNEYRWRVIPIALVLGLITTAVMLKFQQKRLVEPDTDLLAEISNAAPASLKDIGVILLIGALSLLAGASLGPEASLLAASVAIGSWASVCYKLKPAAQLLVLASVGALLVAFLGSIIMVLVPLFQLVQRKQLKAKPLGIVAVASLSSYVTILLLDHKSPGYGSIPDLPNLASHDYIVALIVGFATALLALILNKLIEVFWKIASGIDKQTPWYVSTGIFSIVLGGLYLIFGRTIEFSGSIGSHLLAGDASKYGALALVALIVGKLLATSWSKATGLRGGLVFPSIYMGVALGLLVGQLNSDWAGAGAIIGGIAGMLSSVTGSPAVAAIFVLAILPPKFLAVSLSAIVGTVLFRQLSKRLPWAK